MDPIRNDMITSIETLQENNETSNDIKKQRNDYIINNESLKQIFEAVKSENTHTDDQNKNIDNRVGILITLQAGLLAFFAQSLTFPNIDFSQVDKSDFIVLPIYYLSMISTILLLLLSILKFSNILRAKEYRKINIKEFYGFENNELKYTELHQIYTALINAYTSNIEHNRQVNTEKHMTHKKAVSLTIAAIFSLLLCYISQQFL